MTETRYPSWKNQMDKRINEAAGELDQLARKAPYFMSSTRHKVENLGHIPENATPAVWRAKVNSIVDRIKVTEENQSNLHDGINEFIRVMAGDWKILVEAYEVQGRMLSQLLDSSGIESDEVLMEYAEQKVKEMKEHEALVSEKEETGASLPW